MADNPYDLTEFMEGLKRNLDWASENPEAMRELSKGKMGNPITLAPRVPSPDEWVADMTESAKAKSAKWLKRTLTPRKDPQKRALEAAGKYKSKLEEALAAGKWEKAVAAYDLDVRQRIIEATGEGGFRAGIDRKKVKAQKAIEEIQPLVLALAETLDKMPVVTDADREAKMLAARRGMIEVGKKRRGLA